MKEKKQHINLIIATPGHSVQSGYLKSLLATLSKLAEKKITWAFTSEYSSHVAIARESTLNGGGDVMNLNCVEPFNGLITYDKILWIDSDITFTPEDVIKAYESEFDIVSGAYLLATGQVMAFKKMLSSPLLFDEVKDDTEPIEIEGAGMGFMAVKQGVFEKIGRPWFQEAEAPHDFNDGKGPSIFKVTGEDLSFCVRAREAGFEIWLDPTIQLVHNKVMKLTWDGPRP